MKTGTLALIAYLFFGMFCQFFIYSWSSHYGKITYDYFKDEFESEVKYFNWALEDKLGAGNSVIIAFVAALTVAVIASIILYFYSKTPSPGILITLTYLVVFFFFSYFFNPYLIANFTDICVMVAYGSISCLSANLYLSIPTKQENRKKPKSKSSLELWKLRLELEHSSLKEQFHLSAWVFVFALVGIAFVGMNQYYYGLPPAIANFYACRMVLVLLFVHCLLIIIGFFVGIIYQLIHDMENVIQALKDTKEKTN